jgi:hypothetical protein
MRKMYSVLSSVLFWLALRMSRLNTLVYKCAGWCFVRTLLPEPVADLWCDEKQKVYGWNEGPPVLADAPKKRRRQRRQKK